MIHQVHFVLGAALLDTSVLLPTLGWLPLGLPFVSFLYQSCTRIQHHLLSWGTPSLCWSTSSGGILRKAGQEVYFLRMCMSENLFILPLHLIDNLGVETLMEIIFLRIWKSLLRFSF